MRRLRLTQSAAGSLAHGFLKQMQSRDEHSLNQSVTQLLCCVPTIR